MIEQEYINEVVLKKEGIALRCSLVFTSAVILALLVTGCSPKLPSEPMKTWEELEEIARAFVISLSQEKYDDASKVMDKKMEKALPASELKKIWTSLLSQAGNWQEIAGVKSAEESGYRVVYVTGLFQKGSVDIKVVFDNEAKIAGLWFGSVASIEYEPPSYAKEDLFVEKEVVVGEGKWALPGTLTLPRSASADNRVPGVVLVHGSGPNDRDETIGPNKPFKDLAWGLASKGVAVLRYEKRTREYQKELSEDPEQATNLTVKEETMEDAVAAVTLLKTIDEIDPDGIVIIGHSLGGMLCPRIAQMCNDAIDLHKPDASIAGLVMMAAPARNLLDLTVDQIRYLASLDGNVDSDEMAKIMEIEELAEKIRSGSVADDEIVLGAYKAYWEDLMAYDQVKTAQDLSLPILILQGERDYQVSMTDLDMWKSALYGKPNVSIKTYPDLNHLLMSGRGKSTPDEYMELSHVSEEVVNDIAEWVRSLPTS